MKSTLNSKIRFRTTTALCVVLTTAVVSVAYAADWGRSGWDQRAHPSSTEQNGKDANGTRLDIAEAKGKSPTETVKTASPIKHVIILIGENRGLDHTFGVYKPKGKKETISNLLSKGIVNEDGTPGPNFALAQQFSVAGQPSYYIGAPNNAKSLYGAINVMPQPNTAVPPRRKALLLRLSRALR
jgi:phospholipase C